MAQPKALGDKKSETEEILTILLCFRPTGRPAYIRDINKHVSADSGSLILHYGEDFNNEEARIKRWEFPAPIVGGSVTLTPMKDGAELKSHEGSYEIRVVAQKADQVLWHGEWSNKAP